DGVARDDAAPSPMPWQDPDVQWKPRSLALTFAKASGAGLRHDASAVYGDLDALEVETTRRWAARTVHAARLETELRSALRKAEAGRPERMTDEEALAC